MYIHLYIHTHIQPTKDESWQRHCGSLLERCTNKSKPGS